MSKITRVPWSILSPATACLACKGRAERTGTAYLFAVRIAPVLIVILSVSIVFLPRPNRHSILEKLPTYPYAQAGFVLLLAIFIFEWFVLQETSVYSYKCLKCGDVFRARVRLPLWKRPFYAFAFGGFILFLLFAAAVYFACTGSEASCI